MRRPLGPLALLALLAPACGEPRLLEGGFAEGQTRLRLSPSEFLGGVACGRGVQGALQTYIARLQEVSPSAAPGFTTLFVTGGVPCDEAVLFPAIAGRRYGAEIYGFTSTTPSEADVGIAPWSALCGRGSLEPTDAGLDPLRPTLSERGATVPLRGCTTFSGAPGEAPTRLQVDTASALGPLRCGSGPGQVYALQGTLGGETRAALCQQPLVFDVPAADRYHTLDLIGLAASGDAGAGDAAAPPPAEPEPTTLDAGLDASVADALDASVGAPPAVADAGAAPPPAGVPRWRTSCVGRSVRGATAPATCEPLRALPTGP